MSNGGQCCGVNRSGQRCSRYAKNGVYCVMHDPERQADRDRWKEAVRAGVRKSWHEWMANRSPFPGDQ